MVYKNFVYVSVFVIFLIVPFIYFSQTSNVHIPSSCTLMPGIACTEFYVTPDSAGIYVRYSNESFQIIDLTIKGCLNKEISERIDNQQSFKFFNCNNGKVGEIYKSDIQILFKGYTWINDEGYRTYGKVDEIKRVGGIVTQIEDKISRSSSTSTTVVPDRSISTSTTVVPDNRLDDQYQTVEMVIREGVSKNFYYYNAKYSIYLKYVRTSDNKMIIQVSRDLGISPNGEYLFEEVYFDPYDSYWLSSIDLDLNKDNKNDLRIELKSIDSKKNTARISLIKI